MKKGESICKQLGIKQEELAMLLKISKGQLAMFEIGKRDIPLTAKKQLTEILMGLQANKSKLVNHHPILEEEKKKSHDWLMKEFNDLKFKEFQLERKIEKTQAVREDALKALEVVKYLESGDGFEDRFGMANFILIRIKNTLNKHSLQHLEEMELKKESFKMLKLQLQKKIKM
jgi:transcriptional regulator with XRE-family HTH domain